MKTRIALALALLAASTGLTFAQTPPPPPPPGAEMPPPPPGDEERPGERGPRGDGERGPRGGERGPGGPHGMGKGPRPDGASFHLRMGERRIAVDCGAEPLKACIEASQPLLDLVGGAGPSDMPRPSPSLTLPPIDTPPAPGDLPPPIPGTDAPPIAPAN